VARNVVRGSDVAWIRRNLANDPFLGDTVPENPGLHEYRHRSESVTYAVAADFRTIYLLAIRPHDSPRDRFPANVDKWLDRLTKASQLWSITGGGEGGK